MALNGIYPNNVAAYVQSCRKEKEIDPCRARNQLTGLAFGSEHLHVMLHVCDI